MNDDPTTHDPGDLWADKAPRGWERCPKCGEEWGKGDPSECKCEQEKEEDAEK